MTGAPELRDRAHIPALDGLRGIAILLVIPHNADTFSQSPGWLWPVALLAHAGWIGVQLFFVLSGFLITRNLLARRSAPGYLRSFYGRRALRIFPLYFLTLLAGLVLLPAIVTFSPGALASHHNQVWLWTFLSNWAQPFGYEVSGYSHFWSLAVEEQFYLVWPFVVLLAAGTRLFWICVAVAAAALLSRIAMMMAGARPEMLYMFTNCRMDALALGAAAAVLGQNDAVMEWTSRRIRALMLAALGALAIAASSTHVFAVYDPGTLIAGQTLLALSFAVMMLAIERVPRMGPIGMIPRTLEMRWLRLVGKYSFAMYVFHLPLLIVFGHRLKDLAAGAGSAAPLVTSLAAVALSFIAGLLSFHLIEKHFLRLKTAFA